MDQSRQGRQLAEHYATARAIPAANILWLPGKPAGAIKRQQWEDQFRPAIRAWLETDGRAGRIRCLVACWDVPLRIGPRPADAPVVVARKEFLARARKNQLLQVDRLLQMLESLGRTDELPGLATLEPDLAVKQISEKFDAALKEAQKRVQALELDEKKKEAGRVFERILVAAGGANTLLKIAAQRPDAASPRPEMAAQLSLLRGRLEGLQQGLRALDSLPDDPARDAQILHLLQSTNGLIGTIGWIDQQQGLLKKNETGASFDSELSLIHWDAYPLLRWQPNLLHYAFDKMPAKRRTMMVSRLEAPGFELAMALVDKAVATEKTGLSGKVYLDARGIGYNPKKPQRGSYGEYDQSLRDLAERLKKHTTLEVVLDNKQGLFQPGDCPDAALYCGWYRLGHYVDAFDWRPGAVGYHLASMEAAELRDPKSKVWCSGMLQDGICVTLGPVYEPYLAAFPLPDDFFSLLLTGRYTLVEVYYRTKPFNSWQMTLVGDPLYNPFKHRPQLTEDALPQRIKQGAKPPVPQETETPESP